MTRLYRITGLLTLLLTLLCTSVRAQTTVAAMDFDGTMPEMGISSDVLFFDNLSDGFFGIIDNDGDPDDGVPMDMGDGGSSNPNLAITLSSLMGDYLYIRDLNDEGDNGTSAFATVTFGPVSLADQSGTVFSFDYDINALNGGDEVNYELMYDGAGQGTVVLVDGTTGGVTDKGLVSVVIPDAVQSVSLLLRIDSNEDVLAFDNFLVTAGNPSLPCGMSSFGPSATAECAAFTNGTADEYTLSLNYSGSDANGALALFVDGSPASAFTNNGDEPATTDDGTIDLSSPDLAEGTSYKVTFTDAGGSCAYSVTGSVANNTCVSVCDLTVEPVRFFCDDFTADADAVSAEIRYFGSEPGVTISATGSTPVTVGGNDPATEEGGTGAANTRKILLAGLEEGGAYNITISGGACSGADEIVIDAMVAADLCLPVGDLVINEFYAAPNTSAGEYEFVELYNRGLTVLDISGYSIEEGAGSSVAVPASTSLNPGEGILMAGSNSATSTGCPVVNATFIGLNNGGDIIILRDAEGLILQQLSYGAEANVQESLALSPDGNLDGGYQLHSTVSMTGATNSACANNEDNSPLPVELLSFTAVANGKVVLLNWETSLEVNNDRFLVERLVAGVRWATMGNVPAVNGRNNAYEFVDEVPAQGDNVYRLQQLDVDGVAVFYDPVLVSFTAVEFNVYPNPANDEIRFGSAFAGSDHISLLDANGRVLRELRAGTDRANLSGMPAGIYLLRVARASGIEVIRFVKK
jgi:hypothetical protein